MGLSKFKLGALIEEITRKNSSLSYDISFVRGISNSKEITATKADVDESVISKFYVIMPNEFIYNPRTTRMGEKVGLGYNNTTSPLLFTFNNIAFRIKESAKRLLLSDYLYIYFNRGEFDRYAMTHSWGSATELFTFEEMCDIDIELPPILIQQKYVDIYKAMVANQQSYERGLEDLKLTIDAQLDKIKHSSPVRSIGELLREIDVRNEAGTISDVQGINISKQFMPSVANTTGVNLSNYKVVKKGQFAYSGMQTGRDECIRIALYAEDAPIIISPAYSVFEMNDPSVLPEYIMMWFSRAESDRRGWFMSDSSIRTNLDLERFYEIKLPVPDMKLQEAVVELYTAYISRRSIVEKLKSQIKDICPILIKGSLEEAEKQ